MLREVTELKEADLIIYNEGIYTPEELADVLDLRFLVDEESEEEVENDPDPEEEADPEEEEPEAVTARRKRRSPEEIREVIRAAKELGAKTIKEIQDQTGFSYATIKKYSGGGYKQCKKLIITF